MNRNTPYQHAVDAHQIHGQVFESLSSNACSLWHARACPAAAGQRVPTATPSTELEVPLSESADMSKHPARISHFYKNHLKGKPWL